jgi:hypothetical protein
MIIGRIISSELGVNRDGEGRVLLLRVELSEATDEQTVELLCPPGLDARPLADEAVAVDEAGEAYLVATGCDPGIESDVEEGEAELYSHDAEGKLARVRCDGEGQVVVNQGADWAVQFSALKTAFEELQGKWNDFAELYSPGQGGSPPSAAQSTADISTAKIDDVRLP